MHLELTRRPSTRSRSEDGAVAVMVAVTMTVLLVMAGMVLDFGLVRVDRQVNKSAADSAALAGLHGLALSGDSNAHPFVGICAAIRYLRANNARFSGVTSATGTWTDGNGGAVANGGGCNDTTLTNRICVPGTQSSWLRFSWTGTYAGSPLRVNIQSGYALSSGSGWQEDSLPAATTFQNDSAQGCDQLAVMITQNRKPGFGSLATSRDLVSPIRTVGRVKLKPGGTAPAMLLLRRTGCPILQTGGSGGGSHVYVRGAIASDLRTQAGSIHADSTGASCPGGSNNNIFLGRAADGIVAFAAPSSSNPAMPDPAKPGSISSVAGSNGASAGVISDGLDNAHGSTALDPTGLATATKVPLSGRGMVTRKPIDDRYLTALTSITSTAADAWTITTGNAAANGYTVFNGCSGTPPNVPKVFVNCNAGFSTGTFGANTTTVTFSGPVKPSGLVSIPNATKVYITGDAGNNQPGIDIGTGTLSVHSSGNLNGTLCTNATRAAGNKAVVVLKAGFIKQASVGGLLQLCNTTLVQLGGVTDGCLSQVPSQQASGPSSTPCGGAGGTGQISQTGGNVDWTAPNSIDITTDSSGVPLPAAAGPQGWADPNGPEDLAYWSESYGGSSNPTFNMNGGGTFHVVGVYMAPNANPFTIGGGATQILMNAQYVASSIALNGNNTLINMQVDPNSAVTLPDLGLVGLVR